MNLICCCHCLGFPCGSSGKESTRNAGDLGSIPRLGRYPREGKEVCHSSILAWSIPWTIWSLGSQRVGHDWMTLTFTSPLIETELILWLAVGFPGSSVGKEFACNAGDPGSIPGSGRYTGEGIGYPFQYSWASLVAQLLVKNPPAMWETWIRSLGWEDPLEKGKAAHSSILAWRIPWTG